MAMLVAQFYIVCRFLETDEQRIDRLSHLCMYGSIACHILSLLAGYSSRGAVILMTKAVALCNATFDTESVKHSYGHAADAALAQFALLVLAILLFVVMFVRNRKELGKAVGGN